MEEGYQNDADIFRLRHLQYFGELIEEFHEKSGKYPLQGKSQLDNYVHIAAPHQQKYVTGGPPYEHEVTDMEVFREELQSVLGRSVDLRFDPQKVPLFAPNFYIYMIRGNDYFFAIHLYSGYSFTNSVDKHYNKLEITSAQQRRQGLWGFRDLASNAGFTAAVQQVPHRSGWFNHLEQKYK